MERNQYRAVLRSRLWTNEDGSYELLDHEQPTSLADAVLDSVVRSTLSGQQWSVENADTGAAPSPGNPEMGRLAGRMNNEEILDHACEVMRLDDARLERLAVLLGK
jgi:hypothetical protein